ncbi:hypothetical protein HETIRDRAFT_442224 [Heterobasidion irregulare TC 32-1]|uniref:Uncharacterized protein n=1 Tax=Heterobasidion irregulare (strain TC 32-1) TaxID=747525 RepID=W4JS83_HETIT|nr:uncharacterized protein HETIRDRAFT_442224 [Heterobasidion irregulare TC 32-1]ETW75741.1 hypothetical protein HETIRDRAFT_442224 [Heterobasidion irregulare TC 32-1]
MRGHRVARYKLAISYQELHGVSLFSHLMDHLRPLPQIRPSTEGPMVQTMSRLVQERGSLLLIRGTRGPAIVNLPLRPIRHRRLVSSTPDRTRHCPGMPLGHFLMSLRKRGRVGRNMINTKRSIRMSKPLELNVMTLLWGPRPKPPPQTVFLLQAEVVLNLDLHRPSHLNFHLLLH